MLIGAENLCQKPQPKRINSAAEQYYQRRQQDRERENPQKLNFSHDYNHTLIEQYEKNIVPGPNKYSPQYNKVLSKSQYGGTFGRQKRRGLENNFVTPSSLDYENNIWKMKYNEKKAIAFPKNDRFRGQSAQNPGVGQYTTNKQYDLSKGKGIIFTRNKGIQSAHTERLPGVGQYKIDKQKNGHNSHRFPQQQRFNHKFRTESGNSPGVGAYNLSKSMNVTSNYGSKVKNGKFTTQSRFEKRAMGGGNTVEPSPQSYTVKGYFDNLKRFKIKNDILHRRGNHSSTGIYV